MSKYRLTHLSDGALIHALRAQYGRERAETAVVLAHLAEVEARGLHLGAGYPSLHAWCVGELNMSRQTAFKRITAARVAHRFPAIFEAVAERRLNLGGVILLSAKLTDENVDELLLAAANRSESEIEIMLAERFPRPDVPTSIRALTPTATPPPASDLLQLSARRVDASMAVVEALPALTPESSRATEPPIAPPRVTPLAPQRFALQVTIPESTRDKLRYAQQLLARRITPGDVASVLDQALSLLIERLEKQKFAATDKPRQSLRPPRTDGRHIPAAVKREVSKRDGGQCTYVSKSGHRCPVKGDVQFDHIEEFARGGRATVSNLRLRCPAHNQYAAERTFGIRFMKQKREAARRAAAGRPEATPSDSIEQRRMPSP